MKQIHEEHEAVLSPSVMRHVSLNAGLLFSVLLLEYFLPRGWRMRCPFMIQRMMSCDEYECFRNPLVCSVLSTTLNKTVDK